MTLWSFIKNFLWNPANVRRLYGRPMFLIRLYCVLSCSGIHFFKEFERRMADNNNPYADVEIAWSLYVYRIYPVTLFVTGFLIGDILNVYVYMISCLYCYFLGWVIPADFLKPVYYGFCKALAVISVQVLILNVLLFVFTIIFDWGMRCVTEEGEDDDDELDN